jgi:8-oxo-dGTP pyrophosphatase MutT (NUDIX family)
VFLHQVRAKLFWVISRSLVTGYRLFPVFGPIRGTAAVIRNGAKYLVIDRSDGYGLCFPGGLVKPWEAPEQAVRREVHEETGLELTNPEFKFRFRIDILYPTITNVFVAAAEGSLRSSWEGTARFVTLEELDQKVMRTQRPVVDYLKTGVIPV